MATKHAIAQEIIDVKNKAQDTIRRKYLKDLSEYTDRDTILYCTAYSTPKASGVPGNALSIIPDDLQGFMTAMHDLKRDKLDIIIHSPGGSAEAVEQIMNYLRTKYKHIRAIIPQSAMSAATMLACACDEIVMGKHSALGPIDPQLTFPTQSGAPFTAPAHSLLNEFNKAKSEILADPKVAPIWIPKLTSWPAGILDICEKTIKLAKEKVALWLESYMFNGEEDAHQKAASIAEWLGNFENHLTHGRPIPIATAIEKGLHVTQLEDDQVLQEKVLSVFHASIITIEITNCVKMIENHNGVGFFTQFQRK
mgnify:CR=1 FL=1